MVEGVFHGRSANCTCAVKHLQAASITRRTVFENDEIQIGSFEADSPYRRSSGRPCSAARQSPAGVLTIPANAAPDVSNAPYPEIGLETILLPLDLGGGCPSSSVVRAAGASVLLWQSAPDREALAARRFRKPARYA